MVDVVQRAERLDEIGIVVVAARTDRDVLDGGVLLIATVLRSNHKGTMCGDIALGQLGRGAREAKRGLEGDGVGRAAIEVAVAADLHHGRHKGQAGGGADARHVVGQGTHGQVARGAENDVGGNGVHLQRIGIEGVVVAGVQLVLDLLINEVAAGQIAGTHERHKGHEAPVIAEGQYDAHGTANLVALEAHGIHGARRRPPHACELVAEAIFHQDVQDARSEDPAVPPALEHQRDPILSHSASFSRAAFYPDGDPTACAHGALRMTPCAHVVRLSCFSHLSRVARCAVSASQPL